MADVLEGLLALVGLATLIAFAVVGLVGSPEPADPVAEATQRIEATAAAAEALMRDAAERER